MSFRLALAIAVSAALGARAASPQEVVIGAVYPLSGGLAKVGNDIKSAIELAVDIVNDDIDLPLPLAKGKGLPHLGGAKLRVVFADHQAGGL